MPMALAKFLRSERQRHPQIARARAIRADRSWRHHPDDDVWLSSQRETLTDDIRVTSESALPQLVAKNYDAMIAVRFLLREEPTAKHRLNPDQREDVGREKRASQRFRRPLAGESEISISAHRA